MTGPYSADDVRGMLHRAPLDPVLRIMVLQHLIGPWPIEDSAEFAWDPHGDDVLFTFDGAELVDRLADDAQQTTTALGIDLAELLEQATE